MDYVLISQFFIILLSLTISVESSTVARYGHSSALINDRLYIIGGFSISTQPKGSNDVFYLDLTKPFNTQNPASALVDITQSSGMPLLIAWASSTVLGSDGILLFGGYTWSLSTGNSDTSDNALYLYNTTTDQLTIPTVTGVSPIRRREMKIVCDNNENIYIYSGVSLGEIPQWFTDMNILDANSGFKWVLVPMSNAPTYPRADYTATMLPNGVIVYIGGRTHMVTDGLVIETELNINQLILYDTKDATWYPMQAIGASIDNRNSHSAVLTLDGKIIIYGGAKGPNLTTVTPSLAILDTSTTVYTWSIPQISSQFYPPPLMLHTADLFGNYMIIAYGNVTNGATSPVEVNQNIYMLDTGTFSWITSYTPNISSVNTNHSTSVGLLIGIICAVIVFLVIISIIGWLLYKKYKKRQLIRNSVIATPGSEIDRNYMVESDERDERDEFSNINNNNNRISNLTNLTNHTSVSDTSNREDHRNSSTTDITIISHSRPSSTYKDTYGTSYHPSYSNGPPSYYTPHGGFTPKSPPYSTRN
ncbi:hypothetical protein RclHR1_10950006 [Rhizophagus clarus]|uniref:Attractin/MKLN-like beta-propeller domain-containing protein n=1 Tax=Rhizophagus clarus TaxID=94130 RepID=A0A2Z6QHQ8_9GLOM|nr:hypothetical protein RclHR1_10950006 [Rhizophagus clarus]